MLVVRESDKVMCVIRIKREKDEEINGHQQAMTKKKMREEIDKKSGKSIIIQTGHELSHNFN